MFLGLFLFYCFDLQELGFVVATQPLEQRFLFDIFSSSSSYVDWFLRRRYVISISLLLFFVISFSSSSPSSSSSFVFISSNLSSMSGQSLTSSATYPVSASASYLRQHGPSTYSDEYGSHRFKPPY